MLVNTSFQLFQTLASVITAKLHPTPLQSGIAATPPFHFLDRVGFARHVDLTCHFVRSLWVKFVAVKFLQPGVASDK